MKQAPLTLGLIGALALATAAGGAEAPADLILRHGRIATVDDRFTIASAMAVKDGRVLAVGTDDAVLRRRGPNTVVTDLHGAMVIPGLIDSHTHPLAASTIEFHHRIPDMGNIADVLAYVRDRARQAREGEWIAIRQVFITRLKERRYPTRAELDRAAPRNPVMFATGPDASLNSLALKLSGIDRSFRVMDDGPGFIEKDPNTGEPTGILRSCTRYAKVVEPEPPLTPEQKRQRLAELFHDYNSVGITSIADRDASPEAIGYYAQLRDAGQLTLRVSISHHVDTIGPIDKIQENIRKVAAHPLHHPDPMLQIVGIKTYLDGGMLTGSAYMREPWGVSKTYSITDPDYHGVLFIPKERLLPIVRTTLESGLQFTAHSVGDGAVHTLLDVYSELDRTRPVRGNRPCITHANFQSREAVEGMAKLGVVVDIQPAWLYLDTGTLVDQFGYDRLRYFQPLHSLFAAGAIAGGGSDHMQKIGSLRSVNPYNPFLGMWTAITRKSRTYRGRLHPEEALTREEALRMYTHNNAYIVFRDDTGSLTPGQRADFAILDRDLLQCPIDSLKDTKVKMTYLGGKLIYSATRTLRHPDASLLRNYDQEAGEALANPPGRTTGCAGKDRIRSASRSHLGQCFAPARGLPLSTVFRVTPYSATSLLRHFPLPSAHPATPSPRHVPTPEP